MTIASFTITQRDLISFIIIAPDFFFIVISSSSFHTAMLSDNWIHEIYRHGFCFLLIFIILFRPFLFSLHSFAFSICNNKSFPVGIKWNSPLQWRLYAAASSCGNNLSLNLNYKFSRVIFEDFVELNSLALVVSWLPRREVRLLVADKIGLYSASCLSTTLRYLRLPILLLFFLMSRRIFLTADCLNEKLIFILILRRVNLSQLTTTWSYEKLKVQFNLKESFNWMLTL